MGRGGDAAHARRRVRGQGAGKGSEDAVARGTGVGADDRAGYERRGASAEVVARRTDAASRTAVADGPTATRRDLDVPLVPFLLEGVGGVGALNQADGIHPNSDGQARLAATVWKHLSKLVPEQ